MLCWIPASPSLGLPWQTLNTLLDCVLLGRVSMTCLTTKDCPSVLTSTGRVSWWWRAVLVLWVFVALKHPTGAMLAVLLLESVAFRAGSRRWRAPPRASAVPASLSKVLEASRGPSAQYTFLDTRCDSAEPSLPWTWSPSDRYWWTLARQLWKPAW